MSCVTVQISLHTYHTIGRYYLLPAKFATLQDSVFAQKRQSKLPRKALDVSVKGHKKETFAASQSDQGTTAETTTDRPDVQRFELSFQAGCSKLP